MNLPRAFSSSIKTNVPLKSRTSFRIGGKAKYWFEPQDKRELARFLRRADISLPLFVIGAGSNLLLGDGLIKRIFIHLKSADFKKIKIRGTTVTVGAGVKISRLFSFLISKNLGGYEFLAGIPGTIGGALAMNAGARSQPHKPDSYREMKDIVLSVDVVDRAGRFFTLAKEDIKFSYRQSSLRPYIIVAARLKLVRADKKEVRQMIKELLLNRRLHQEGRYPSAGSFFKNPKKTIAAGRLIDLCRLKGLKVGSAQVSDKHANFIINRGDATARDVKELAGIVNRRVWHRFRIKLQPEVEIVS